MVKTKAAAKNAKPVSLITYVSRMGIAPDVTMAGELAMLREETKAWRGRTSIVRKTGQHYDQVTMACAEAGYPVENFDQLCELLAQDAVAWFGGDDDTRRVWAACDARDFNEAAMWEPTALEAWLDDTEEAPF